MTRTQSYWHFRAVVCLSDSKSRTCSKRTSTFFWSGNLGFPAMKSWRWGAIASGGVRVLNYALIERLGLPADVIERITRHERQEIERQERFYREDRSALPVDGRTIILVDDGL